MYTVVFGFGRLAQLVEHLVYTEGVGGSSPSSPTSVSQTAHSNVESIEITGIYALLRECGMLDTL